MPVILRTVAGPATGTEIRLEPGRYTQVGRGPDADLLLSADTQLSPLHFSLECDLHACRVVDLDSRSGTQVNGVRIVEALARNGDRITAGTSAFQLEISPDAAAASSLEEERAPVTARSLLVDVTLSPAATALLDDQQLPLEFLDRLLAEPLRPDAALVIARWLPKPQAVGWAADCVGRTADQLPPAQAAALAAARTWAEAPNESHRRAAEAAVQHAGYEGAASFVALAAFWSEGSLAPVGLPDNPPAPALTAKALVGALQLAAAEQAPLNPAETLQSFLQAGRELYAATVTPPPGAVSSPAAG